MMAEAVLPSGEPTVAKAWDRLFRHLNQQRGKGDVPYRKGEQIVIKPNWVGMIWRRRGCRPGNLHLHQLAQDYMNTGPQMIIALLRQLASIACPAWPRRASPSAIRWPTWSMNTTPSSTGPFRVKYEDFAGQFGRLKVQSSTVPLYWSCRPAGAQSITCPPPLPRPSTWSISPTSRPMAAPA